MRLPSALLPSYASFGNPSRLLVFFLAIMDWFPRVIIWLYNNSNDPGMQKLRRNATEVRSVAQTLLDSKRQELKAGAPRKDTMSFLGTSFPPFHAVGLRDCRGLLLPSQIQ